MCRLEGGGGGEAGVVGSVGMCVCVVGEGGEDVYSQDEGRQNNDVETERQPGRQPAGHTWTICQR